jgi:hypothetical protein
MKRNATVQIAIAAAGPVAIRTVTQLLRTTSNVTWPKAPTTPSCEALTL